MPRLALAFLTLVLAGCGASTYAQPKPDKVERSAEQTEPLLGSMSFSQDPSHTLAVVSVPDVTGVGLIEQAVGTKEPFGNSAGKVSRRFLVEAKDKKDGTSSLVAVVEVLDPTGLWIGSAGASQNGESLAIVRGADGKLAGEACATVADANKRVQK
jgi:hypothetical protein